MLLDALLLPKSCWCVFFWTATHQGHHTPLSLSLSPAAADTSINSFFCHCISTYHPFFSCLPSSISLLLILPITFFFDANDEDNDDVVVVEASTAAVNADALLVVVMEATAMLSLF